LKSWSCSGKKYCLLDSTEVAKLMQVHIFTRSNIVSFRRDLEALALTLKVVALLYVALASASSLLVSVTSLFVMII